MSERTIGVPSMGGIGSAFRDFGIGAIAGLGYLLLANMLGGIGIIAAPLLIGAMIKGDRGKMIATIAGFMLLASFGGIFSSSSASSTRSVM
jgi:hypothetical protein